MAVTVNPPPAHCARILPFPQRERPIAMPSREQKFAAMEAAARMFASVAPSSAWYHDEAVEKGPAH